MTSIESKSAIPQQRSRRRGSGKSVYSTVVILFVFLSFGNVNGGWVDVDTPWNKQNTKAYEDGYPYHLVFSDEFNVNGRNFHDGNDPRWTSINKDDYTNYALQYYNENLANTNNGYLNLRCV